MYGKYGDDMRGARNTALAQSDGLHYYYHGENSSGEATTSRNSEIDQQIEYELVFARQLQAMDNLTIETPADEDDGMHSFSFSFCKHLMCIMIFSRGNLNLFTSEILLPMLV